MIEVTLNQEDHSYMFDDDDESTTPVKACSESGYHHVTTSDQTIKKLDVPRQTRSALKRRRMLQFEDQPMETSHLFTSESFSSILRSSVVSVQNQYLIFSYESKQHLSGIFDVSSINV